MGRVIPLVLIVLLMLSSAYAVSIGAGGEIFLKDVLKGGFATGRVYVSNPNEFPITISAWLLGDTADWMTLSPQMPMTIDANSNKFVDVTIQPPPFIANGVYTGSLVFVISETPEFAEGGAGVSISAGATINAIIEISDKQNVSSRITTIVAERTEECKPINIKITSKNEGNIEVTPTYTISLYHTDKGFIRTETVQGAILKPTLERTDTVSLNYNTQDLGETWSRFLCLPKGEYYANITVANQLGQEYYKGSVNIYILEKGALSVSGKLNNLEHKDTARLGEPVKITGKFENTGDSTEYAKLKIEAYKEDRLVEIVSGDEIAADPGKVTDVVAYFTPKELGDFSLHGTVNFGGKFTNTVESELNVTLGLTIIILIVAIPLIILIIIILIWLRKRRGY